MELAIKQFNTSWKEYKNTRIKVGFLDDPVKIQEDEQNIERIADFISSYVFVNIQSNDEEQPGKVAADIGESKEVKSTGRAINVRDDLYVSLPRRNWLNFFRGTYPPNTGEVKSTSNQLIGESKGECRSPLPIPSAPSQAVENPPAYAPH